MHIYIYLYINIYIYIHTQDNKIIWMVAYCMNSKY